MKRKLILLACALIVAGAAAGGALYYAYPVQIVTARIVVLGPDDASGSQ